MTETHQDEGRSPVAMAGPALDGEAALAMLRGAEADQQAGNAAASRAACETLIAAGKYAEWAYFLLGRLSRDEGDAAAATDAFTRAIDADPVMFWAHCERLIAAREAGVSAERRSEMIDTFVAFPWEPLEGGALRKVELIAHAQWDDGHGADAHRIFEKLWPAAELDHLTLVRIVEANRDAAMVEDAVTRLEQSPEADETTHRILLQHYERVGETDKQIALLEGGALSSTVAVRTLASIARSFARKRRERRSAGDDTPSAEDAEVIARLRDFAATAQTGDDPPPTEDVAQIESIAHVLWDAGDRDSAYGLFARLWPAAEIGTVTLLRIVESDRDDLMVDEATARLEAATDLDETALRILTQHFEARGDADRQIALLERGSLSAALTLRAWAGIARGYARRRRERSASGDATLAPQDATLIARLREFAEAVEGGKEPSGREQVAQIESIAHVLWDDGYTDSAHRIFARMWPSPDIGVITLVRILDGDRDPDLVAGAVTRLEEIPDLDETALRILFEHYERHRDVGRQLALLDGGTLSPKLTVRTWAALARSSVQRRQGTGLATTEGALVERATLIARLQDFVESVLTDKEPSPTEYLPHLESIGHVLWDAGDAERAFRLFSRLWPSTDLTAITLVRIVEADRDAAMAAEAVERLEASPNLNDTAMRIVGEHHAQRGDVGREIALLQRQRTTAPKDFQTWVALARSYAKNGDRDRAMATLEDGSAFPVRQRMFARLITQVELGNANAALLDFRSLARLYDEVPKYPGIRLAYMFGDAFDVPRRSEVLGLLDARYVGDREVALVHVNAAMRDQRWADARRLFDENFSGSEARPQSVRLANIDILAFSGDLEAAHALLEQERTDGVFPTSFLRSTLRILGELERWDEAFTLGLEHLANDTSFEHFLAIMIRAGRKTGRSEILFEALLALPPPLNPAQHEALFAVMEDLAEAGHLGILDRVGAIEVPYERAHRIQLKLRSASAAAAPVKDLCIYYCADRNYLMPALVSLTALAMSNVSVARRAVFHLVVDSDAVTLATDAGGAIARRLGLTIKVVDAATIVSSADRLRTGYGLFTGGQQLALAAYYRIFFARHLAEHGGYTQALYVDADTIVRFGLEELFAMEHTAPVMARYETDRPEVRHATAVHQLKGRYFNSGVLHFNLAHPDLPALLDCAIAAAIDPEVTLIFQDQCALNIAFDMRITELPPRFNFFNPPDVSGDGIAATDAVIVHFLDRPKPWDSLYRRRAREWFEWFDLVQTLRQDALESTS